jgi:hypothetical protein
LPKRKYGPCKKENKEEISMPKSMRQKRKKKEEKRKRDSPYFQNQSKSERHDKGVQNKSLRIPHTCMS